MKRTMQYNTNTIWKPWTCFNPSNAEATFVHSTRTQRFLKTILMSCWYSLNSSHWALRWIPMCQGFTNFSVFLPHFVQATLATCSVRVKFNPFTLRVTLQSVFCYSHTFENNFWIERKFTKHLKKSSCLASKQHISLKYFQENASVSKIFPNSSGLFWPIWVLMG